MTRPTHFVLCNSKDGYPAVQVDAYLYIVGGQYDGESVAALRNGRWVMPNGKEPVKVTEWCKSQTYDPTEVMPLRWVYVYHTDGGGGAVLKLAEQFWNGTIWDYTGEYKSVAKKPSKHLWRDESGRDIFWRPHLGRWWREWGDSIDRDVRWSMSTRGRA